MRKIFLCVFFLITVSFIPCEDVLYRVIKDTPAWHDGVVIKKKNNIAMTIKKDEIVKGKDFFLSSIDEKDCFVSVIEYSDYDEYIVRTDILVPANTVNLFDDSLINMPDSDSRWLLDYYLYALMSRNRDTFYEFEYYFIDLWNKGREYRISSGSSLFDGNEEWYEEVCYYDLSCLEIFQTCILVGGFLTKNRFLITNIVNINNGYKVTVVDCIFVGGSSYGSNHKNTIAFPTDKRFFDLLLIKDNDFIDMYLDTTENYLATFVRVNKDIVDELTSLLRNNICDLSKIKSFPKRADGGMIKYSPPEKDTDVFWVEDKMSKAAIEKKAIKQNNGEASTLPLWAWFAIIGGAAVAVGGGVVFAVKRK
jgi:hypothetical protein